MKSPRVFWRDFLVVVFFMAIALIGCQQQAKETDAELIANAKRADAKNESASVPEPPVSAPQAASSREESAADADEQNPDDEEMTWWRFDEGKGKEISNSTNNSRYRGIFCGKIDWLPGIIGPSAMNLDGETAYIALQSPVLSKRIERISIAVWIKPKNTRSQRNIIVHEDLTPKVESELFLRIMSGQYQVGLWHGMDHMIVFDIPKEDEGNWVHLAGVYDGKCWFLYHNGELVAARRIEAKKQGPLGFSGPWTIGGSRRLGTSRYFMGQIDELRLYNRALTPEEVSAIATPRSATEPAQSEAPQTVGEN